MLLISLAHLARLRHADKILMDDETNARGKLCLLLFYVVDTHTSSNTSVSPTTSSIDHEQTHSVQQHLVQICLLFAFI